MNADSLEVFPAIGDETHEFISSLFGRDLFFLYELLGPGQVFQALSATENDGPFPRLHRVRLGMACGLEVGFPVKIEFGQAFFRRDDI